MTRAFDRLWIRARAAADKAAEESRERNASQDRYRRAETARGVNYLLKLDPPLEADALERVSNDRERALYAFTYDGLEFVAGKYWHGNPGDDFLIAVKVGKAKGRPEWPPPSPRSAHNTRWAPSGYARADSLVELGRVLEGVKS